MPAARTTRRGSREAGPLAKPGARAGTGGAPDLGRHFDAAGDGRGPAGPHAVGPGAAPAATDGTITHRLLIGNGRSPEGVRPEDFTAVPE